MDGKVFGCVRPCNVHLWLFLPTQHLNSLPPLEVSPDFCYGSQACFPTPPAPRRLAASVQACDRGSAMHMLLSQKHNWKLMIKGSECCTDFILEREEPVAALMMSMRTASGSLSEQLEHHGHFCLGGLQDNFSSPPRACSELSVHLFAA